MEESLLKRHKFVVLDGDHFNPLGIVRSLGETGIMCDVIAINSPNAIMTKSKYVNRIAFVETVEEGIEYILNNYLQEQEKPFILTGNDSVISAIDSHYDQLKDRFHVFNCGKPNGINSMLSKYEQNVLAREAGLDVPDFEEVNVGDLPKFVKYPILTKAATSLEHNWKSLTHICRDEQELLAAYATMDCKRILLQSYIEKDNETGFDALSIRNGKDCYLPLQLSYHYTTDTSFGNSIYFFKPADQKLLDGVRKLIELTGFEGIFSMDFLQGKDGKLYFLEINFRNSAWSYPSTCAGVNLPYIWSKSVLRGKLETEDVRIKKLPYTAIDEISELLMLFIYRKKSLSVFWKTLSLVFNSESYNTWNIKDMKPFLFVVSKYLKNIKIGKLRYLWSYN